jgi:hypothetical protein
MIVIGTRWHFVDLYQEILDNHRDDYNVIIRRAIKEDGTALFPQTTAPGRAGEDQAKAG